MVFPAGFHVVVQSSGGTIHRHCVNQLSKIKKTRYPDGFFIFVGFSGITYYGLL